MVSGWSEFLTHRMNFVTQVCSLLSKSIKFDSRIRESVKRDRYSLLACYNISIKKIKQKIFSICNCASNSIEMCQSLIRLLRRDMGWSMITYISFNFKLQNTSRSTKIYIHIIWQLQSKTLFESLLLWLFCCCYAIPWIDIYSHFLYFWHLIFVFFRFC